MRFLVLTQYYPPEVAAPQVRLEAMVRELRRAGHEVEVVTAMPNHPIGRIFDGYRRQFSTVEQHDGVTVRRVWIYAATGAGLKRMLNYGSFTATSLWGLVRSKRPDVLFVESPPLFLAFPGWLMSRVWRRPFVFNVADLWPDSATEMGLLHDGRLLRFLLAFERWTYRRARIVNAVTEGLRDTLIGPKAVPAEKVAWLPNGVDVDMFAPRAPDAEMAARWAPAGRRVVVYAGTVGYAHGLDVGLDAMVLLRATHPDAHLLVFGGGSERARLEARLAAEGITNVSFHDPVPPAELARIYTVATAGLSTLRDLELFEGTRPSKVFPMMAAGLPVLYSGRGEGERLVRDHDAGLITPPEDAAALAAAIARVLDDPAEGRRLGANGRRLAEAEFSWAALVAAWLERVEPVLRAS